jgi:RNA polymerase sigma-70 factor (ECF subfamily)
VEIAAVYFNFQRKESAYHRRVHCNKTQYSLDRGDGIENDIISDINDPVFKEYMDKLVKEQLYAAISSLPEKQAKRIYAKYILGLSQAEIARAEGVAESAVGQFIARGLLRLEKRLKKILSDK